MRIRNAKGESDLDYIRKSLPKVTKFGYHETDDGWMEAITDGSVTAVLFESGGKRLGFALLSIYAAGRSDRSLYIAALAGEQDKTENDRAEAMKQLDRVARLNGCSRLTFNSTRKGWERVAKDYGFKRSPYVTFEREVAHGR